MSRTRTIALSLGSATVIGVGSYLGLPELIKKWEGERFEPYLDEVGKLTVCYGHTGPDIIPGKRYTLAECEALLAVDIAIARADVQRCLPLDKPQHVDDALTSAAFNLGAKVVCGSTLQRKALAGDWAGACAELDRWKYAGKRVLRGLVLRRADERALCEGRGDYASVGVNP